MSGPAKRESLARLAEHLDQRERIGEPAFLPEGLKPDELRALLRTAARAGSGESRAAGSASGGTAAAGTGAGPRAAGADAAARPPATRTATEGFSLPQIASADHEALRGMALSCTRCRLSEGRKQVVFSDGNPSGRLMVVGEAPGAREDATGLPFVGQAGKLLDLMLAAVGLSRKDSVYICNVLKCRPPGNRNPLPDEIDSCAPLLKRQIELVAPEVLLAAGSFAAQWLTATTRPLGKLRGEVYSYQGVPLVVTYHPAALLRNPGWSRLCWDDLQLLRQVMDGA